MVGQEGRYIKNESRKGPCYLVSPGKPWVSIESPIIPGGWGKQSAIWLAVARQAQDKGREEMEGRTEQNLKVPPVLAPCPRLPSMPHAPCPCPVHPLPHPWMQAGLAGWEARACMRSRPDSPAASLTSAGSRPNWWAARVPHILSLSLPSWNKCAIQFGQPPFGPVSIGWNRQTTKAWRMSPWPPGSSHRPMARPRVRGHPRELIQARQGSSAAAHSSISGTRDVWWRPKPALRKEIGTGTTRSRTGPLSHASDVLYLTSSAIDKLRAVHACTYFTDTTSSTQ